MKKIIHISRRAMLLRLLISFCILSCLPLFADTTQKTIRVACVGDSITYGAGIQNRESNSYPAQLSRMLSASYDVRNFGVNGATMLEKSDLPYLHRSEYTNALDFAPDILVIMLGTNDSKHHDAGSPPNAPENWAHKADYVPDYEKMIAAFRQTNPKVKVFVCLPPPAFSERWGINDKTIHDEIIPLIRKVARASHAKIIDLNKPLAGKPELFSDTIHPNTDGAKLLAATVYHALTGKKAPENP
jgi:lysophospholipase L1-like esterase